MERQTLSNGFGRIKIDFAFALAGGEAVKKDFTYDRQRNYYIKEIFGDSVDMSAVIEYGRQYKLASEYMFPNTPTKIRNQRFLLETFASCVLLDRMSKIKSYTTAIDEYQMRYACRQGYEFDDGEVEDLFFRKLRDFHNQYTQQLSKSEYEKFCELVTKYAQNFSPVLKALENAVFHRNEIVSSQPKRKEFTGFECLKADFLFMLAAGEIVQKDFTYEKQVEYYIKAIYGTLNDSAAINNHGKDHRRFSQYIFPNSPEKIHKRKLLFQVLGEGVLIQQIALAPSYTSAKNEIEIRQACLNSYGSLDSDMKNVFVNEAISLHAIYMQSFSEKNFESFKKLMKKYSTQFNTILESLKKRAASNPEVFETVNSFLKLCDRWGLSKKIRVPFRLKMDAFLEVQIGSSNEYVDYIDNLQHTWQDEFPKYPYCDYFVEYVRQEKSICIMAYGNKLGTIHNDTLLFELLASVSIKLAIIEGIDDLDNLHEYLGKVCEKLPREEWRKIFNDGAAKFQLCYFPDNFKNYGDEIINSVLPYKDGLNYINDILMDEINFRANDGKVVDEPQVSAQIESESPNYDEIIAQKDAEILSLQKDLEYYENLNQRDFRNDILQYDKGLTDVFKKLCERKFGAPLNELYLMSVGKKEITSDNVRAVMQNFLFILNSLGVNPYEDSKLGKVVKFDSEEANIVYAVDEKKLVDGLNKGILKYPGWKYKGEELVLPIVDVE